MTKRTKYKTKRNWYKRNIVNNMIYTNQTKNILYNNNGRQR